MHPRVDTHTHGWRSAKAEGYNPWVKRNQVSEVHRSPGSLRNKVLAVCSSPTWLTVMVWGCRCGAAIVAGNGGYPQNEGAPKYMYKFSSPWLTPKLCIDNRKWNWNIQDLGGEFSAPQRYRETSSACGSPKLERLGRHLGHPLKTLEGPGCENKDCAPALRVML